MEERQGETEATAHLNTTGQAANTKTNESLDGDPDSKAVLALFYSRKKWRYISSLFSISSLLPYYAIVQTEAEYVITLDADTVELQVWSAI